MCLPDPIISPNSHIFWDDVFGLIPSLSLQVSCSTLKVYAIQQAHRDLVSRWGDFNVRASQIQPQRLTGSWRSSCPLTPSAGGSTTPMHGAVLLQGTEATRLVFSNEANSDDRKLRTFRDSKVRRTALPSRPTTWNWANSQVGISLSCASLCLPLQTRSLYFLRIAVHGSPGTVPATLMLEV